MVKPRNEKAIFLKTFDFSAKSADHIALLEAVDEAKEKAKISFNIEVDSYVSDHAAAEKKTGEKSGLINYGCYSHAGNLYLKDIKNNEIYRDVHEIMVVFRNASLESRLKEKGGSSIYLAGNTRWKGERDEENCFLKNRSAMKTIVGEIQSQLLPEKVKLLIKSEEFFVKVSKEVEKLSPVCDFIDLSQSDDCTLSTALNKWLKMKPLKEHYAAWENRNKMICKLPALVAYSLDPKYKGILLNRDQTNKVNVAIYSNGKGENAYQQLENFRQSKGKLGCQKALNLPANMFWDLMKTSSPELSEIALKYTLLPSSTASLERTFSMWSYVHNKLRNRLSNDRSEKLIFIYHTLKQTE